jgi:hypothetical protein
MGEQLMISKIITYRILMHFIYNLFNQKRVGMTIRSFISNTKEFGYELTKAVGEQALFMSPFFIGSKVSQLAGYRAPFNFLLGHFSNVTFIGAGLHSAAKLTGPSLVQILP